MHYLILYFVCQDLKRQAGLPDDYDEDEEDSEEGEVKDAEEEDEDVTSTVQNLKVFCVSAVEYLKLRGKLPMDGSAQVIRLLLFSCSFSFSCLLLFLLPSSVSQ